MTTFAIKNDDLFLDSNGNIAIWKDDMNALKQTITNELQTFLSEVFTDERIGVDYFGILLNDRLDNRQKQDELSRVILAISGVQSISEFNFYLDKATRIASYDLTIQTIYGVVRLQDLGVMF